MKVAVRRYLLIFFVWVCLPLTTQAAYYLYQLPDGSRVITDRPKFDSRYKLVRASRSMNNMGKYAAGQAQTYHAPVINYMRFEKLIHRVAGQHKVDAALVKAVIHTESYFNPNATSHKGASGLMQLMPATAQQYGVTDLYSPKQNIDAGVRYLKDLLKRYPNKLKFALAAYNAGEQAVEKYRGVPPYRETRNYIKKVLKYKKHYNTWP